MWINIIGGRMDGGGAGAGCHATKADYSLATIATASKNELRFVAIVEETDGRSEKDVQKISGD